MKPKQYMKQYENTFEDAREIIERIEWLQSQKTTLQQIIDGMPHGKGAKESDDRLDDLIIRVDELKNRAADELETLINSRLQVEKVIQCIEDSRYKRVLYGRYVELKTWEQIAEEIGYSYQWTCELHRDALVEVGKIITKKPQLLDRS